MDKESRSTELQIYFEFASRGDEVPEKDLNFVKSLLDDRELFYDHYDKYNISTELFVDSDKNMKEVDEIESQIQDYFDEFEVNRYTEDDEIYGVQPGTYRTYISIEATKSSEDEKEGSSGWQSVDRSRVGAPTVDEDHDMGSDLSE